MPLILTMTPRGGGPPERRTLSEGTISLGRGAVSDWVLADPERLLSKTHCMIGVEGSRYVLTDLSINGVFINGAREPTARDSRVFLTDGDTFRLGDYTVTVTEVERVPAVRETHTQAAGAAGARGDPFAGDGDLDDPFGGEPGTIFRHPVAPRAAAARRVDDPFAAAGAGRADPDDDLFAGLTPDPSWSGAAQADDADAVRHAFAAPKIVTPPVSFEDLDLDALLGDVAPGQAPPETPPGKAVRAPVTREPAPTREVEVAPSDATDVLAAFLEGAGVPGLALPGGDAHAAMREAGRVFRALAAGVREVLMSRAAIKNELRVEQTMMRSRDNNALKFSVTAEEAVAALLLPARTGYKAPVAAVDEAYRDIQSHEMAVMAGVQTALTGLLKRFDPVALEGRLQPGRLDGLLPGSRKARIWELFCATYGDIAREAEDDFQSVFGREFAKAYEAQMRKL